MYPSESEGGVGPKGEGWAAERLLKSGRGALQARDGEGWSLSPETPASAAHILASARRPKALNYCSDHKHCYLLYCHHLSTAIVYQVTPLGNPTDSIYA